MAKEKFVCSECDGEGTVTFKQEDTRFKLEVVCCPFCGADLGDEIEEDEDE